MVPALKAGMNPAGLSNRSASSSANEAAQSARVKVVAVRIPDTLAP